MSKILDEMLDAVFPLALSYAANLLSGKLEKAGQLPDTGLPETAQETLTEELLSGLSKYFTAEDQSIFAFQRACEEASKRAFVRL